MKHLTYAGSSSPPAKLYFENIGTSAPKPVNLFREVEDKLRKEEEERAKSYYVYLLEADGHGWFKIGVSLNPKKRLHGLTVPFKIKIVYEHYVCGRKDAYSLEKALHTTYAALRIDAKSKEWYTGIQLEHFKASIKEVQDRSVRKEAVRGQMLKGRREKTRRKSRWKPQ